MDLSVIENDPVEVKKYMENFVPINYYRVLGDEYLHQVRASLLYSVSGSGLFSARYEGMFNEISIAVGDNTARISSQQEVWADMFSAGARRTDELEVHAINANASIKEIREATASQNAAQASINTTLQANLDDIIVGGRNLIVNSTFAKGYEAWGDVEVIESDHYIGKMHRMNSTGGASFGISALDEFKQIRMVQGNQYSLSFYGFGSVLLLDQIYLESADGTLTKLANVTMSTDLTERRHIVFTAPIGGNDIGFVIGASSNSSEDWFSVSQLKLELGTRATDWTPAPEDVDGYISSVQSSIDEFKQVQVTRNEATALAIETLDSRVGDNTSQIVSERKTNATKFATLTQTAKTLTGTTADNTGRIEEVNTVITGKYESIASKVTTLEADSSLGKAKIESLETATSNNEEVIASTTNNLSAKIDGIDIGGRNLLRNADFKLGYKLWGTAASTESDTVLGNLVTITNVGDDTTYFGLEPDNRYQTINIVEGKSYVLSFYAEGSVTEINDIWVRGTGDGATKLPNVSVTTSLGLRTELVFVAEFSTTKGSIIIGANSAETNDWFAVTAVKLEQGNKATDWTAAPEDTREIIESVEANINEFKEVQVNHNSATAQSIETMTASIGDNAASITNNYNTLADKDQTIVNSVSSLDAAYAANKVKVTNDIKVVADANTTTASKLETLETDFKGNKTSVTNSINSINTKNVAFTESINNLTIKSGENTTAITNEATARVDGLKSVNDVVNALKSEYEGNKASISQSLTTLTNKDTSLTNSVNSLTTRTGNNETAITDESTTRSNADSALSTRISTNLSKADNALGRITTAETTIANHTTSIAQTKTEVAASYKTGSYGKNLFIQQGVSSNVGYLLTGSGGVGDSSVHRYSDYIPVMGDTYYVYHTREGVLHYPRIVAYDSNKNYITGDGLWTGSPPQVTSRGWVTPSNAAFIRVSSDISSGVDIDKWKIEVDKVTPYSMSDIDSNANITNLNLSTATNTQAIAQTKSELTASFNSIEIGGRNYARNFNSWNTYGDAIAAISNNGNTVKLTRAGTDNNSIGSNSITRKGKIAVSVNVKTTGITRIYIVGRGSFLSTSHPDLAISTVGFELPSNFNERITVYQDFADEYTGNWYVGVYGDSPANSAEFSYPQFEKGTKASDWTAALEDTDAAIAATDAAITEEARVRTDADKALSNRIVTAQSKADTAFGKITTAEGTIASHTQAIAQTKLDLVATFNDVRVGGRNLLKDSGISVTSTGYAVAEYPLIDTLVEGEQLTLTIWGSLASDKVYFSAYNSGGRNGNPLSKIADGVYQVTFNWTVDYTNDFLRIYHMPSSVTSASTIDRIKLERGNKGSDWSEAGDIGYDEANKGKNLYDVNKVVRASYVYEGTGSLNATGVHSRSDYIEVRPNTKYTLSIDSEHGDFVYLRYVFYDVNKNYISGVRFDLGNSVTITTPKNCKYLIFSSESRQEQYKYWVVALGTTVLKWTPSPMATGALLTSEAITRADADGALGERLDVISIKAGTNEANIEKESKARVSAVGAITTDITKLQTAVTTNTALVHYDMYYDFSNWKNYSGSGSSFASTAGVGIGSLTSTASQQQWLIREENIPLQYGVVYRVTCRYWHRQGTGRTYVGVAGVKQDGTTLVNSNGDTSHSAQHYIGSDSAVGSFEEITGFIADSTTDLSGLPNAINLHADAKFFRPLVIVNYSNEPGLTYIRYFKVEVVDKRSIASIEETKTSVNGLSASWSMKLNVNGKISGIFQNSTSTVSDFEIVTDNFKLSTGTSTGLSPFRSEGTKVYMNNAFIKDGDITNAKIGNLAVDTAQLDNGAITNAKVGTAAIKTANIDDLAVTTGKIKDLAVDTLKIKDYAVTASGLYFAEQRDTFNIAKTESEIAGVDINPEGGSVAVSFGFESLKVSDYGVRTGATLILRLKRDNEVLRTISFSADRAAEASLYENIITRSYITFATLLDSPPKGNRRYAVTAQAADTDEDEITLKIKARSLMVSGAKK